MHASASFTRTWQIAAAPLTALFVLAGCGGGDSRTSLTTAPSASTTAELPPAAATDKAVVKEVRPGVSPFIAFVDLDVPDLAKVQEAGFRIEPRPGTVSLPVQVEYTRDYLFRRGFGDGDRRLSIPVFGLYAGYTNAVDIHLDHEDGTTESVRTQIETQAYVDPNGVYDRPTFLKTRTPGDALGFDFMFLKSLLGGPVLVDTDGQLRWVAPGVANAQSSMFYKGGFIVGSQTSPMLQRVEMDGSITNMQLSVPGVTNFHHDISPGKSGLLVQVDGNRNGTAIIESILLEINPDDGSLLRQWDLADSVTQRMQAHGEDASQFVRPGVDWFHMNSALYSASDDSLLVSGREDFVAKLDYESGQLRWLFGDPGKYWYSFPSLAALNLGLAAGGLWPIGQHALSFTADGRLMLFNNGQASNNQPPNEPVGQQRSFSAVSIYAIDEQARLATEVQRFVHPEQTFSAFCSSASQTTSGGAMFVDYANAGGGASMRLVGVKEDGSIALDIAYPNTGCSGAWNAQPIALNELRIE